MSNIKYPISNRGSKRRAKGASRPHPSPLPPGEGDQGSSLFIGRGKVHGDFFQTFTPLVKGYWDRIEHPRDKLMWSALVLVLPLVFFLTAAQSSSENDQLATPQPVQEGCIWEICSIDTMKTSRDMARTYLNVPSYDEDIRQQLKAIHETGADYVSINTPFDEEFLPYLKRWVSLAREEGLKVWFRGNWSSWEGWFGYPKNMTPEEHLVKNSEFISTHPELFQNGDIFDPCPECENALFWPQNDKNSDYRQFIQSQQEQTKNDFKKINKQVMVYPSVIGGRAKDVLDRKTFDALSNVIAIDHYVPKKEGMSEYIDYFSKLNTKSLISEFGAPIPDMNGNMNDKQQSEFIGNILEVLYQKKTSVKGLNYWVLSHGTTALLNNDYSKKPSFDELKKYFSPARVEGRVINPLGEGVKGLTLRTSDQATQVQTDDHGYYHFFIPPRKFELILDNPNYSGQSASMEATESGQVLSYNFSIEPKKPGIIYLFKLWWQKNF